MKIAGNRTARQWGHLSRMLRQNPSPKRWEFAFEKYYMVRIESRYLSPMRAIAKDVRFDGAGFAITTLFCSLVEFLESCECGGNFVAKGPWGAHEYGTRQAGGYFKAFFRNRAPFDRLMPAALVESFYSDVRCGLVHEARTKRGGWTISARAAGQLVGNSQTGPVLFRNRLLPSLETYFADYRRRLLAPQSHAVREAFLRKFDFVSIP